MAASVRKIGNETKIDRILNRDFLCIARNGYVEVGDENICLPVYYENFEEKIRNFQVRDDDVFLIAHPKTGTTWTAEMVWLITNNFDYEAAKEIIYNRFIHLEYPILYDMEIYYEATNEPGRANWDPFKCLEGHNSPRCIKSHLHWSLLPEEIKNFTKKPKIISVLRKAEDVCVSYYHHAQSAENYTGSFEDFCELFMAGRVTFGPFWKQIKSCWQQKDKANILFIKYKDMKDDICSVIRRVARFLEKNITESEVHQLAKHLSFDSMKNNPAVNYEDDIQKIKNTGICASANDFIREGKVGNYKTVMSGELIDKFDEWTKQELSGTDLYME